MLLKIPFYPVKMFLIIYTMHLNDFVVNGFDFNKAKMGQPMYICLMPELDIKKTRLPNNLIYRIFMVMILPTTHFGICPLGG